MKGIFDLIDKIIEAVLRFICVNSMKGKSKYVIENTLLINTIKY